MRFKLLLVIVLTIMSKISFAQTNNNETESNSEWTFVGNSDNVILLIRNEYVSKNYAGIKIWTKWLSPVKKVKGRTYKFVSDDALMLVDCSEKTLQTLQILTYCNKKVIDKTGDYFYKPAKVVPPNSMGEKLVNTVCELYND